MNVKGDEAWRMSSAVNPAHLSELMESALNVVCTDQTFLVKVGFGEEVPS